MTIAEKSLLGKDTDYDQAYSSQLLFPLDRSENRKKLALNRVMEFHGEDLWACYELSWLNSKGKPFVGIAYFYFPYDSPYMIESKSFKLYLNSINHLSFTDVNALQKMLTRDLSSAAGAPVKVEIFSLNDKTVQTSSIENISIYDGASCIDDINAQGFEYQPNSGLLKVIPGSEQINETLYSNLLRSNCPVTGQPDWGSVYIHYSGQQIDRESLLKYIVSFRQCQDFHEHCVETIYVDLMEKCQCDSLSVYARYTRRGGLDINPYRATPDLQAHAPLIRTSRQ